MKKYNRYAMKKNMVGKPVKCNRCGNPWKYLLEIHHKDKNPENNQPNNLEWLCKWCHYRVHGKMKIWDSEDMRKAAIYDAEYGFGWIMPQSRWRIVVK